MIVVRSTIISTERDGKAKVSNALRKNWILSDAAEVFSFDLQIRIGITMYLYS
jgi:hypothetical protein